MDILYIGYFNSRPGNALNIEFIERAHNELENLMPDQKSWASVVKIIVATEDSPIFLVSNLLDQYAEVFTTAD